MSDKTRQNLDLERFPIRTLSELSGVGTSTLRAWERRYGLLQPERTPKGHRLYCQADRQRVLKILNLLNDGHSLGKIAQMLANEKHKTGISEATTGIDDTTEMSSVWQNFIQASLEATSDFNIERIDTIYNEASSLYPVDMVTERLIEPTIARLGTAWKEHPERGIAEEHFYTSWLKNRLGARFHHAYSQARGARIICACAPGNFHEIGLMLFALSALTRGYRVLYFGANLPLDQLPYITQRSAAKAVILAVQTQIDSNLDSELVNLIPQLDTPVFIGGPNELINTDRFESAGGILLGANISVALRVFESHIPAFSGSSRGS